VETVVIALAALACPVGMLVMGVCMAKGMRRPKGSAPANVDELRAEHQRLGADIERLDGAEQSSPDVAVTRP
jgi:hypothetical protein